MRHLFFALLYYCMALPLFADSITNHELLNACKDKASDSQNFCYGFIISTANAAQFYRNIVDVDDNYIDICFPETIANQELVELYIAWAEKNTQVNEEPAFIGVSSSFSTKYSCPKKDTSKDDAAAKYL